VRWRLAVSQRDDVISQCVRAVFDGSAVGRLQLGIFAQLNLRPGVGWRWIKPLQGGGESVTAGDVTQHLWPDFGWIDHSWAACAAFCKGCRHGGPHLALIPIA
jgi:hypothetical protein